MLIYVDTAILIYFYEATGPLQARAAAPPYRCCRGREPDCG